MLGVYGVLHCEVRVLDLGPLIQTATADLVCGGLEYEGVILTYGLLHFEGRVWTWYHGFKQQPRT